MPRQFSPKGDSLSLSVVLIHSDPPKYPSLAPSLREQGVRVWTIGTADGLPGGPGVVVLNVVMDVAERAGMIVHLMEMSPELRIIELLGSGESRADNTTEALRDPFTIAQLISLIERLGGSQG